MSETFACVACEWEGKNQGALTAHVRKQHANDPTVELQAKWGEFAPRAGGGYRPDRPLRAAPSGIPSIDYAIGIGGVPRGTIIEIYGPPGAGKTFTALTFSAHAQKRGGLVGFVDAEHALQPTFPQLAGVDLATMYYSAPPNGEAALDMTRDFISTGLYDIWTVDSVHACTPRQMIENQNGTGSENPGALAQLMSQGCQIIDHVIARTDTLCIFINHVKDKVMAQYGRTWYKPGGNALDYYSSVQLRVSVAETHTDKRKRQIGHTIRIKVDKSKVSAPHATAEFDLYYADAIRSDGKEVHAGVDAATCWFDVLRQAEVLKAAGGRYFLADGGEALGTTEDVLGLLAEEDNELISQARDAVYPREYAPSLGAGHSG